MLFKSKRRASFALIALILFSAASLKNLTVTKAAREPYERYSVEFEYFGMDAEKMERLVAIPFEEKALALEGLLSVSSVSEYSKCVTSLVFERTARGALAAVSGAADELKRSLPQDAQSPKIRAAGTEAKFAFCAAFDKDEFSLGEIEKKALLPLQGAAGVGHASLSGGESPEIHVAFDDALMGAKGLFPWDLAKEADEREARFLSQDGHFFAAPLFGQKDIGSLPKIKAAASVREGMQKRRSVARLNGKKCLLLSVKSADESQNIAISREAKKILEEAFKGRGGWKVVYDNGMEQKKALEKIYAAFVQTALALAVAVFAIYRSAKKTALVLAFMAVDSAASLALLSALKVPLDGAAISGLSVSLGLLCDAALYVMDDCRTSFRALFASTLTTIAALVPLAALEKTVPGVRSLCLSSGLSIALSGALAAIFLPHFVPQEKAGKKARKILNLSTFLDRMPRKILNLSIILYILPFVLFVFLPKNIKSSSPEAAIFAQVEFSPEKSAESVDKEIAPLLQKAQAIPGVILVQSEAARGRAELRLLLKDAAKKDELSKALAQAGKGLSGSLYVPLSPPKKKAVQTIQAAVLGDDPNLCKALAREAASLLLSEPFFAARKAQAALNFKDGERVFLAVPDKDFLARSSLSVRDFSQFLRWCAFAPVALKIHGAEKTKDVRVGQKDVAFGADGSLEKLLALNVKGVPVGALCAVKTERRPSRIYRKDLRRAAFFTLEVESKNSLMAFSRAKKALKGLSLPDGYYISFPQEYEGAPGRYAEIFALFSLASAAIFFLAAASSESLSDAAKVILSIPLSLCLPLLAKALLSSPLRLADAVGMVFLSGLSVNNALYILAEFNAQKRRSAAKAAEALLKSVLSSSVTTLAGAVPMMAACRGSFAGDLAFFMFFGTIGSALASLVFFPNMLEEKDGQKKGRPKRRLIGKPASPARKGRWRREA